MSFHGEGRVCVCCGEQTSTDYGQLQAIFSARERWDTCLSKHRPRVASCFASMSIWLGPASQLPGQLQAFWPDLNSEDGPRGPGTAPALRVEPGRLPILTKLWDELTPNVLQNLWAAHTDTGNCHDEIRCTCVPERRYLSQHSLLSDVPFCHLSQVSGQ